MRGGGVRGGGENAARDAEVVSPSDAYQGDRCHLRHPLRHRPPETEPPSPTDAGKHSVSTSHQTDGESVLRHLTFQVRSEFCRKRTA